MNTPDRVLVSSAHHVVDWQLVGTAGATLHDTECRDVRERIRVLEARALTLLRTAVTSPGAAAAQRSLSAIEVEIASLRADLAWRRAEVR